MERFVWKEEETKCFILDKQANLLFNKVYFKALSNSHFLFFHSSSHDSKGVEEQLELLLKGVFINP